MRNQCVHRAVADLRTRRHVHRLAAQLGVFPDVLYVVEPGRIERARDERHLDLDIVPTVDSIRRLVRAEGGTADLADAIVVQDAVQTTGIGTEK